MLKCYSLVLAAAHVEIKKRVSALVVSNSTQAVRRIELGKSLGRNHRHRNGTRLIWHIGREMRARGSGRILITSSTASQPPGPFAAMYFASKTALESFGQSLRLECDETGVSVTLLHPGTTKT